LLIVLLVGSLLYFVLNTSLVVTSFILACITGFSVIELIRYVEKANREFSDFLQAIRSEDFTRYDEDDKRGRSFSHLKQAFNAIIDEFQMARIDKEAHYIFLQTVVAHINTAIISFDDRGAVKLINESARTLFDIPFLDSVAYLSKVNIELHDLLISGFNGIAEITVREKRLKLLFRSAGFRLQGTEHRLVVITNVKSEIDRTEIDAWEQLLHVLTHEIMNSITPVSSLSGTIRHHLNGMLIEKNIDQEMLNDMAEGLQVIENRSAGLIGFVNNYRSLISLPRPDHKKINIGKLFENITLLVSNQLAQRHITLCTELGSSMLFINADESMIEQVLLNLINNAADAVEGYADSTIRLSAELYDEHTLIKVTDNGTGIDPEIRNRIFIPFFTTKNHGTGIGLSLTKQIMQLHNGSIDVHSEKNKGTTFTLSFP